MATNHRDHSTVLALALFGITGFGFAAVSDAQNGDGADAADDAPIVGPPVHSGRDRVSGTASRAAGGIFDLAGGGRLVVPAGLPIGTRTFTFSEARGRVSVAEVAPGFAPVGKAHVFDGAIDATRAPVEFSLLQRRFRLPARRRLVLAMETLGACDASHATRLVGPLCSTWQLLDARYHDTTERLLATIPTPSGHRLAFGTVPVAP